MQLTEEQFAALRQKAEEDYKQIGTVLCPFLHDDVHFNSEGFEHLLFKAFGVTRSREEQYMRLKLVPLAVRVLKQSHTMQEYSEERRFERVRSNGVWQKALKLVKYYGFVAIINNALIKVIVKEVEGRNKHFYSIIPRWREDIIKGNKKRVLHRGNPEED